VKAAIVVGFVCALVATASAHPMDIGYLRITAHGSDLDIAIDLDIDATVTPDVVLRGCTVGPATETVTGRTRHITRVAHCEHAGAHTLELPWVTQMPDRFQLLAQQGESSLGIVDHARPEVAIESAHAHVGLGSFIASGIAHIGAAPSEWRDEHGGLKLPDGIDHILFLLGLLLGGGSILRLLGVATGFTVGHTITLALATLGVVHPPSRLIEPLIALSIAFVAVEAMTRKWEHLRWKIALGFGLVHGFGFANALTKLQLSTGAKVKALFGYNLGVELGQLVIVILLAPLVLAAWRRPWSKRWILMPAAATIFVAGMYWFVIRLLG
jgi:hypothetical protein